jgi:hypothetical protein
MRRDGRALNAVPGLAESGGYACAVLYGTGITEILTSGDARAAIGSRRNEARSLGVTLDDWWTSVPHEEWRGSARTLTAACRTLGGTRTGPGRFSGVDFGRLCREADDLRITMTDLARGRFIGQAALSPDARMATAVRYRAEGLAARESAALLGVSHTTVNRDLARWGREAHLMPLEIVRLSRPAGTPARNIQPSDVPAGTANVPAERSSVAHVVAFRRPA